MNQMDKERFLSKISKQANGCWNWTVSTFPDGYGQFKSEHKNLRAHRVAYELFNGPIPDNLCVCHTCDNRLCVNPAHLFLADNAENTADRHRKGRDARGEKQHNAILTTEQVMAIRSSFVAGMNQSQFAREHGVNRATLTHILSGRTWKHIK